MGAGVTSGTDYLTLVQAAERCGLAPSTLRWQVRNGRLQAIKVGRDYLTTRAWLAAYLASLSDDGRRRATEAGVREG